MTQNRPRKDPVTLLASAARTTSSNGGASTKPSEYRTALLFLRVSASSGISPTLDVHVRAKDPLSGEKVRIGSFAQQTGTGTTKLSLAAPLGLEWDVEWEIGGTTPSFTFSVSAAFET